MTHRFKKLKLDYVLIYTAINERQWAEKSSHTEKALMIAKNLLQTHEDDNSDMLLVPCIIHK